MERDFTWNSYHLDYATDWNWQNNLATIQTNSTTPVFEPPATSVEPACCSEQVASTLDLLDSPETLSENHQPIAFLPHGKDYLKARTKELDGKLKIINAGMYNILTWFKLKRKESSILLVQRGSMMIQLRWQSDNFKQRGRKWKSLKQRWPSWRRDWQKCKCFWKRPGKRMVTLWGTMCPKVGFYLNVLIHSCCFQQLNKWCLFGVIELCWLFPRGRWNSREFACLLQSFIGKESWQGRSPFFGCRRVCKMAQEMKQCQGWEQDDLQGWLLGLVNVCLHWVYNWFCCVNCGVPQR